MIQYHIRYSYITYIQFTTHSCFMFNLWSQSHLPKLIILHRLVYNSLLFFQIHMRCKTRGHHISLTVVSMYNCMFIHDETHNNHIHIPNVTNNHIHIPDVTNNRIHVPDVTNIYSCMLLIDQLKIKTSKFVPSTL